MGNTGKLALMTLPILFCDIIYGQSCYKHLEIYDTSLYCFNIFFLYHFSQPGWRAGVHIAKVTSNGRVHDRDHQYSQLELISLSNKIMSFRVQHIFLVMELKPKHFRGFCGLAKLLNIYPNHNENFNFDAVIEIAVIIVEYY